MTRNADLFEVGETSSLDDTFAIKGCNLRIRVLDDQISKLEHDEDNKITLESRVKTALKSKGIKECLARLHRQLSALNLIITAYNV